MITDFLLRNYFKLTDDFTIPLGSQLQRGSIFVVAKAKNMWQSESLSKKVKSILRRNYDPSKHLIEDAAKSVLIADIFGGVEDFGDRMLKLMAWHGSRKWVFENLTNEDQAKAEAGNGMTILARTRFINLHYSHLNLNLWEYYPLIAMLVVPMVVKIPLQAIRYYPDIHYEFAFNSIRKSKHPQAEALVNYLYEISNLQKKIIISLHEFIRLVAYAIENKKEAILINAEVDAIQQAENILSYLKASIEKAIVFIGLIYDIPNLDNKKHHAQKISALLRELPPKVKEQYYWQAIEEFISTENLKVLNDYRNGVLHKMGVANLQPHSYVGKAYDQTPFKIIFEFLHEQHTRNTIVFIGSLALLTDKLMILDPISSDEKEAYFELYASLFSDLEEGFTT